MRAAAVAKQPTPIEVMERPATQEPPPRSREDRLAAWAAALERCGDLVQLTELDRADRTSGRALRRDGTAASVALVDPRLRAAGLRDDTVGALCDFFLISPNECHRVLCQCGASRAHSGRSAAATVRRLARRERLERAEVAVGAALLVALGGLFGLRLLVL